MDYGVNACYGVDVRIFYSTQSKFRRRALALCKNCTVKSACLERGLKHEEFGIWGGTTAEQRVKIRTERGITVERPEVIEEPSHEFCGTNRGYVRLYRSKKLDPSISSCLKCERAHYEYYLIREQMKAL